MNNQPWRAAVNKRKNLQDNKFMCVIYKMISQEEVKQQQMSKKQNKEAHDTCKYFWNNIVKQPLKKGKGQAHLMFYLWYKIGGRTGVIWPGWREVF